MKNITKKGIWYIVLNFIDALITTFVLKAGGEELNPFFNVLLSKGYSVYETKMMILIPLMTIWKVILEQNPKIAVKLLNVGLVVMKTLIIFELIGIAYIYI